MNAIAHNSIRFFSGALIAVLCVFSAAQAHAQMDSSYDPSCCGNVYDTSYSYPSSDVYDTSYSYPSSNVYDTSYSYPTSNVYDTSYSYPSSYSTTPYTYSTTPYTYSTGSYSYPYSYSYPSYSYGYSYPYTYSRPTVSTPSNSTSLNLSNYNSNYNYNSSYVSNVNTNTGASYYPTLYGAPSCTMTVQKNYLSYGEHTTLSWWSTNVGSGYISGLGMVQANGNVSLSPSQTTQYNGTFTGPWGTANCYATIVVNGTPSYIPAPVPISQIPYTGLDLGPAGTALYFLSLILLCALAAYAFAVKKIHAVLITKGFAMLFGNPAVAQHPVYAPAHADQTHSTTHAASQESKDTVDEFILGQIARLG